MGSIPTGWISDTAPQSPLFTSDQPVFDCFFFHEKISDINSIPPSPHGFNRRSSVE